MDEAERTLVLERWNATARDYPQRNIAELFEAEAQRRPKAVGEVFGAEQVSYAGLNRRANRLARYLRKRGVNPDYASGSLPRALADRRFVKHFESRRPTVTPPQSQWSRDLKRTRESWGNALPWRNPRLRQPRSSLQPCAGSGMVVNAQR
jgi:hypothetical protein